MSLKNRKIKGKSFRHPLSKANLSLPLTETEKQEAIEYENWDLLIHSHMRLGCSIAGRYVAFGADFEEMVSAAMLGIVDAIDRYRKGEVKTDNITGYIVAYIHRHCTEEMRKDHTIITPRNKKPLTVYDSGDIEGVADDFNITDFEDMLRAIAKDPRDLLILDLRMQGYTDKAIEKETGIPRPTVTMVRLNLLKRYNKWRN